MITASGANFGYYRSLNHILGISFGFPVMMIAIGFGLGGLFHAVPQIHIFLKYFGAAYILWMAWKIVNAGGINKSKHASGTPLTFIQAAGFQWVNPKAWAVAVSAISTYTSLNGVLYIETSIIAVIFFLVCFPAVSLWALFGVIIGKFLTQQKWLRLFNIMMALLLMVSLLPLFFDI